MAMNNSLTWQAFARRPSQSSVMNKPLQVLSHPPHAPYSVIFGAVKALQESTRASMLSLYDG
jgi:hypothetical protein